MLESNIFKLAFCLQLMVTCNTDSIVTRKHLTAQFVKKSKMRSAISYLVQGGGSQSFPEMLTSEVATSLPRVRVRVR